jgi:predicted membrane-bound mannosyltransferase
MRQRWRCAGPALPRGESLLNTTDGESLSAGPPLAPVRRVESAGIERWLDHHSGLVSLTVIAAGLAIRLLLIRGAYLDADEATHFELANVPLADLYRSTLAEAHPPFFFLLLHFWMFLGNSESFLRLLSVLLGALFLAVAYGWSARLFGKSAAFFTLAILAFSPAFVSLSAEVRGYSLLLLLMVSTVHILERAIEVQSVPAIICFSGLLYLTILTHYSALWFTLAIFVYVLTRIRRDRLPPRIVGAWLVTQLGAAIRR